MKETILENINFSKKIKSRNTQMIDELRSSQSILCKYSSKTTYHMFILLKKKHNSRDNYCRFTSLAYYCLKDNVSSFSSTPFRRYFLYIFIF